MSVTDEQVGAVLLWSHALGCLKDALHHFGIDRQAYYNARRRAEEQGTFFDVRHHGQTGKRIVIELVTK